MRAKEFLSELNTPTGPTPGQTLSATTQPDPNKLTAMISSLQKQVQDLQKAALQSSEKPAGTAAPPGPVAPIQPVGSVVQQPNTAQQSMQAQPNVAKPGMVGKTVGAVKSLVTPAAPKAAPGVNQSSQITNMKIKQQLAQNQGKGT